MLGIFREEHRFARDSPLEGDGFEPSVPRKKQPFLAAPLVPVIRLPQQKPALSCQGPMVRIHLPPAASQERTPPRSTKFAERDLLRKSLAP